MTETPHKSAVRLNMAKNGTRPQKHFAKPVQRKFATTSNTSTRLCKVYTVVSTSELRPLENDLDVVMDPLDTTRYPDRTSEQLESISMEIDCPAGINVRTKPPWKGNSVSLVKIFSNILALLFRTHHCSLGKSIVRTTWIYASHWKAEAANINLTSVLATQTVSNQLNSVVGSASAVGCIARVASSGGMKIDPCISSK